jgi:hypothetical protein
MQNEVRAVGGKTRPVPVYARGTGSADIHNVSQEQNHVPDT